MTPPLVLSLFPGIGLLDMAFEQEGFCVVRGPDLLWGGDIRRFHPPPGRFDGVIGGPPCQAFSVLRRFTEHNGGTIAENLIPEFERVIAEAAPTWFLMENVPDAPRPIVSGYHVQDQMVSNREDCGGEQNRVRRFSFGSRGSQLSGFALDWLAPPVPMRWMPTALAKGGSGTTKRTRSGKRRIQDVRSEKVFREHVVAQGLPDGFDLPGFTVEGKIRAIGNGVPLTMGRVIARAVRRALGLVDSEKAA